MKAKTIKIIVFLPFAILLLLAAIVIYFSTRTSQDKLDADRAQGIIGEFKLDTMPQYVILRPGLRFKFDTGADFSSITEDDLHFLDSLGYKAKESNYTIIGRDGRGDMKMETKRYTLDLPVYPWSMKTDSLGNKTYNCLYSRANTLKNVNFAPSRTGFSVLGMDFIEKFLVEYRSKEDLLALYFNEPAGYEYCEKLRKSTSPSHWFLLAHRYYLTMDVDGEKDEYFLDTGVRHAFVKRPLSSLPISLSKEFNDTVSSLRGVFPAVEVPGSWLTIGNREGATSVFYYDNDEETNAVNPLNMFQEIDVLFDFPGETIKFRK